MDIKTALLLTKGDVFAAAILAEGGAAKRGSTDERIDKLMRKYKADQLPEAVQNFVDEKTDRRYGNPRYARYAGQLPDDVAKELFREYLERSEGPSAKRLRPTDAEETGAGASTDAGVPDATATDSDDGDIAPFGAGVTDPSESEDEDEDLMQYSDPEEEFYEVGGSDVDVYELEGEEAEIKEKLVSDEKEDDRFDFYETAAYQELFGEAQELIYDNLSDLSQHALEEYQQAWNRKELPVDLFRFVQTVDYTKWVQKKYPDEWGGDDEKQALIHAFENFWHPEDAIEIGDDDETQDSIETDDDDDDEVQDLDAKELSAQQEDTFRKFFGLEKDVDLQDYQLKRDYDAIADSENKDVRTLKGKLEKEFDKLQLDNFDNDAEYPSIDWFNNHKLFEKFRRQNVGAQKLIPPFTDRTRGRIASAVLHHKRRGIKQHEVVLNVIPAEKFLKRFKTTEQIREELNRLRNFWNKQQEPELFEYGAGLHVKLFQKNPDAPKELILFKGEKAKERDRKNYDLLVYIYNDLEEITNDDLKIADINYYRFRDDHAWNLKKAAMEFFLYLTETMKESEEGAIKRLDKIFRDPSEENPARTVLALKIDGEKDDGKPAYTPQRNIEEVLKEIDEKPVYTPRPYRDEKLRKLYWKWKQSLRPAPEVDDELREFIKLMREKIGFTSFPESIYGQPPDDYSNFIPEQMSFDFWETKLKKEFEEWIDKRIEDRRDKFEQGDPNFWVAGPVKIRSYDTNEFQSILRDPSREVNDSGSWWKDSQNDVLYVRIDPRDNRGNLTDRRRREMKTWAERFVFGYGFSNGRFTDARRGNTLRSTIARLKGLDGYVPGWWSINAKGILRHLPYLPPFLQWVDERIEELVTANVNKLR